MSPKLGPAKFAYVVVASTRKHDPAIDITHAPAAPQVGDVLVFPEDHGRAEYIREDDHEVLVDIIHLHFIAVGRQLDNGDVEFSYEAKRLLALLQIGAQHERVTHQEIDRVFERFEEFCDGYVPLQNLGESLERLRKEFV